jgi:hypothetical protein
MCMGGSSPKPAPAPAQAAPVTATTPEFAADAYDQQKNSETQAKQRRGKRGLRIARKDSANVNSTGAGLNIPQA